MEKKASSVDWFYQQIRDNGAGFTHEDLMEWYRQAKAIHKEQYIDVWMNGQNDSGCPQNKLRQFAEEDYNQTYGDGKETK